MQPGLRKRPNGGRSSILEEAAEEAQKIGMGLNAGHDLDLNNLRYFTGTLPDLLEVSIGHAPDLRCLQLVQE